VQCRTARRLIVHVAWLDLRQRAQLLQSTLAVRRLTFYSFLIASTEHGSIESACDEPVAFAADHSQLQPTDNRQPLRLALHALYRHTQRHPSTPE
jgi:hypothetical protein